MTSSVEETCSPEGKPKLSSIPQQEHGQDPPKDGRKPDAHIPIQEEEPEVNKRQENTKPDGCLTSQMDDLNIDDKPDYRMPSQEEGNDSITLNDDDDDDVFDSTGNDTNNDLASLLKLNVFPYN